jgi:hypothetical protein
MKTPEEILKNWSFYGKIPTRELEKIIEQAQTEAWNEGAIEELTKAKWEAKKKLSLFWKG